MAKSVQTTSDRNAAKPTKIRPRRICIRSVIVDPNVNQRVGGIDARTVADYAEEMAAGESFPPLVVFRQNKQTWLADGFHRLAAAKHLGWSKVECVVFQGGLMEATVFACGSNARHGRRRTNVDKRNCVFTLLRHFGSSSDRDIARRAAVTHPFVAKVRRELSAPVEPEIDLPPIDIATPSPRDDELPAPARHCLADGLNATAVSRLLETLTTWSPAQLEGLVADEAVMDDLVTAIWQRTLHEFAIDGERFFIGKVLHSLGRASGWPEWFGSLPEERQELFRMLERTLDRHAGPPSDKRRRAANVVTVTTRRRRGGRAT
jgi:hypothetical protein